MDKKLEKRIEREEKKAERKRQEELRNSEPSRNSKKKLNLLKDIRKNWTKENSIGGKKFNKLYDNGIRKRQFIPHPKNNKKGEEEEYEGRDLFDDDVISEYKYSMDGDNDAWDYKTSKEIQKEKEAEEKLFLRYFKLQ